jgi:ankyrin repeat protein
MQDDKAAVELLIANGADINAKAKDSDWTPLHYVAYGLLEYKREDKLVVVELLITNGADINAKTFDGCTPLHWAKEKGYKDVAELLKKHGAQE